MNKEQSKTKDLLVVKKETADLVLAKIKHFQQQRELDLPPNYSAPNALKSAWLILQETVDKDKRPALDVCTKASIANALLDLVIQGLNPAKNQAYFIVYGNRLTLQRSYFGTKAVALRVAPDLDDIFAEVIYKGDELEYRIDKGRRVIEKHKQNFANIKNADIAGAYAVAIDKDGEVVRSELMTMDQLKQAWKQSRMKPVLDNGELNPKSTHAKFTEEMCKKTVTSRLAKHFINASNDSDLIIESAKRTDEYATEFEAEAEAEEFANSEVIDIDPADDEISEEEQAEIHATVIPGAGLPENDEDHNEPSEDEQAEIHAREMAEAGIPEDAEREASAGPGF